VSSTGTSRPLTTAEELAALRAEIAPKLERIEQVMNLLLVKRPTLKEQAKQAGVSPSTLCRRRQRLAMGRSFL